MIQLSPAIATDGQKIFTLPRLREPALITINGVILQPSDFAIDGETVRLVAPVAEGDEVGAICF